MSRYFIYLLLAIIGLNADVIDRIDGQEGSQTYWQLSPVDDTIESDDYSDFLPNYRTKNRLILARNLLPTVVRPAASHCVSSVHIRAPPYS